MCLCLCIKSLDVKYMTLHNIDEVLELFTNHDKEQEGEDEGLEDEEDNAHSGKR